MAVLPHIFVQSMILISNIIIVPIILYLINLIFPNQVYTIMQILLYLIIFLIVNYIIYKN